MKAYHRTVKLMENGVAGLETRLAVILASRKEFDAALEMVDDQLRRSVLAAVGPVASAFVRHEREEDAVRLLERGTERGDVASHVVLADYLTVKQQYTQASDHYLIAMAHGCEVRDKVFDALTREGKAGKTALDDFKRYGLTPAGRPAEPWAL
jgi:hypothetical protein